MHPDHIQHVDAAITQRHSVRAFLSKNVDQNTLKEIIQVAVRAPSGANTQPWQVYVVTGQKRDELIHKVCTAQTEIFQNPERATEYQEAFPYYPQQWFSPYIERRRENGWSLYSLLNIEKGDKTKMALQHLRNYQLFDAPVGLFFTVHQSMGIGAKMDISMLIQNIMIAAKARGLDTCPQAAWNPFHKIVLEVLGATDQEELVCGMALGYADPKHIINSFTTPRETIEKFTVFLD